MEKKIVSCPDCGGKMKIPHSTETLRVTCPFCSHVFRLTANSNSFSGSFAHSAQHTKQKFQAVFTNAVHKFTAWSPAQKLFLYISVFALILTVLSNRQSVTKIQANPGFRPYDKQTEKKYLLEDPAFISLLKQKALEQKLRR